MECQGNQEQGVVMDKKDIQDQLEKKACQELEEKEDQKASRVLMVYQVELVSMVTKEIKDNVVNEGFEGLQVLLGRLDHQDVCVII